MMKWLFSACLVALWCHLQVLAARSKLGLLHEERYSTIARDKTTVQQIIQEQFRSRRAAGDHSPILYGNYSFVGDSNNYANIQYFGSNSPVILVLTFTARNGQQPFNARLYRSNDYGASFAPILDQLDSSDPRPSLWSDFFISQSDQSLLVIQHSNEPKFYYSTDEGVMWSVRTLSPATINPRSLVWNSANNRMALAHDPTNDQLYVTQTLGQDWIKIADLVSGGDYQWGDPTYDADASVVYFNTYNVNDQNRSDFSVSLRTQRAPFNGGTLHEFDPNLGRHDDFFLLGPYIFAQKQDLQGVVNLYVSYARKPFQKAMIPTSDPHEQYIVTHIDEQQAVVIVQHSSGQYNMYLSELTGVYFALSLPDIVFENSYGVDLEVIEGVNGTLMANQYIRNSPSEPGNVVRTLISLDNGGNWELVSSTATPDCLPPQCSLHFNMTNAYARTGIYSQASAPGIILAHGNTGRTLDANNHDLFISRDGGVTWSQTLEGSWGVTVVDHGGLLVAARDYRQTPSRELRYSCDEGSSWSDFEFSNVDMTVYGVVTEPGEHTTTVSLYGVKGGSTWDVVTINFSSIFLRTCSQSDYYYWHPWDDRLAQNCLLGSSIAIERRVADTCCLIGRDYFRPSSFSACECFSEDFECDYGYMRAEGLTGSCVRDNSTALPPASCGDGAVTYYESQGYRKVAGDVCNGGVESTLGPVTRPCCVSGDPSLNECQQNPSPCVTHATCIDTLGSFVCICQPGYSGNGMVYGSGCSMLTSPPCSPSTVLTSPQCSPSTVLTSPQCTPALDVKTNYSTGSASVKTPSVALIVVGILLVITLLCATLLGIVAVKLYLSLQKYRRHSGVGGIHYRSTPAEEEPLTLNASDDHDADDDDDDPLLT